MADARAQPCAALKGPILVRCLHLPPMPALGPRVPTAPCTLNICLPAVCDASLAVAALQCPPPPPAPQPCSSWCRTCCQICWQVPRTYRPTHRTTASSTAAAACGSKRQQWRWQLCLTLPAKQRASSSCWRQHRRKAAAVPSSCWIVWRSISCCCQALWLMLLRQGSGSSSALGRLRIARILGVCRRPLARRSSSTLHTSRTPCQRE